MRGRAGRTGARSGGIVRDMSVELNWLSAREMTRHSPAAGCRRSMCRLQRHHARPAHWHHAQFLGHFAHAGRLQRRLGRAGGGGRGAAGDRGRWRRLDPDTGGVQRRVRAEDELRRGAEFSGPMGPLAVYGGLSRDRCVEQACASGTRPGLGASGRARDEVHQQVEGRE